MDKILVIGCPGSGKSTFAAKLHAKTGIPLHHIDMLYWNKAKTTISSSELIEKLNHIMLNCRWIIDDNYKSTLNLRLSKCDTVFLLDYPLEICLEGVSARIGISRSDLPWIEDPEDAAKLSEYVREYHKHDRSAILDLLNKYSNASIHIFKSRGEADAFLNSI